MMPTRRYIVVAFAEVRAASGRERRQVQTRMGDMDRIGHVRGRGLWAQFYG
jgi:hypothetical protein